MGITNIQSKTQVMSGNGFLQIGTSSTNLQDVGGLEGDTNISIIRQTIPMQDGQPQLEVKEEVVAESCRVACVLKEKNLEILARQLGYATSEIDDTTYSAGSTVAVTDESKNLYEENWAHLYGCPALASPAIVVESTDPTPITYTEDVDYVIDLAHGAIRRIEGGAIADGQQVYVSYSYTQKIARGLHVGGKSTKEDCMVRFVYTRSDGMRHILEIAKAYPADEVVQAFRTGNWNLRDLAFTAIADMTKSEGERLIKMWHEIGSENY